MIHLKLKREVILAFTLKNLSKNRSWNTVSSTFFGVGKGGERNPRNGGSVHQVGAIWPWV